MKSVTPFLWFSERGGEAMEFYASVFKNSKILNSGNGPDGSFFMGTIEIEGQKIHMMGTPSEFKFNESFSLFVSVETQEEVDYYWNKLTADGGAESMCGWLKDKFGISWQIIPEALMKFMSSPDREKANRAMQAMLKMRKIDIAKLESAFNGK